MDFRALVAQAMRHLWCSAWLLAEPIACLLFLAAAAWHGRSIAIEIGGMLWLAFCWGSGFRGCISLRRGGLLWRDRFILRLRSVRLRGAIPTIQRMTEIVGHGKLYWLCARVGATRGNWVWRHWKRSHRRGRIEVER